MLSGLARAASIFGNNVHIICMLLAPPVPVRLIMENTRSPPSYAVKNIETVANGSDLGARLYTLAPGDMIPWHFHSQITDWYFCLGGCLRIEMRASPAEELLVAGETYSIPPGTAHRISNGGDVDDCRFLLLQGVGIYDFNGVGN
jgi:quercetin dioxygenase-like cupin family protein